MAKEVITGRYKLVDENNEPIRDEEGKIKYAEGSAEFDFGETLADLISMHGEEAIRSDAIANMRVSIQGLIRSLHKQNPDPAFIQAGVTGWKSGVSAPRTKVDPTAAVLASFASWPKEKQREFLKQLQGK